MNDLVVALGLVLAIEGTLYAAAPGVLKRMMQHAVGTPDGVLRIGGLVALAIGVALVWLIRH
ncbi:hypothetical protein SAMN02745172_02953 [Pseudoxanthobacter soli DSM 19599]|uniref:DUF2065 domain-containing protein n=1 Tax=Pseudoxanthobacter soli DSM 19599 TaxID=1123029 RepID=A0A1M7ZN34_9HYPH|nr:DUF2065 domain-containing protein [Pseudoxanthobacter soli]SHO66297.1 hypothetical protein SAMN02745172_02953 [Pseudoxanthobacter soli DSM 19599]